MKAFAYLTAGLLAIFAAPASAQIVRYDVHAENVTSSIDPRDTFAPGDLTPGGLFTFNTETNQLLSFRFVFRSGPLDYTPNDPDYTFDPSEVVIALFNAAGPCDLQCVIGAVEDGSFNISGGSSLVVATINFGAPVSDSIAGRSPGWFRFASISGGLRVTGPVPEPSTWAMMLMGFGAMGFALRRSKRAMGMMKMA